MNVMITGVSGFIGRTLARALVREGHRVTGLSRQADVFSPGAGINHILLRQVTCVDELRPVLAEAQPDVLFHLAGTRGGGDPAEVYRANCVYVATLLEALRRQSLLCTRVFLFGSAAEYGLVEPHELPVSEDHTCQPIDHYGVSKHAQTLLGLACNRYNQSVCVLRPFTVLGPGMPTHLAVASFVRQVLEVRHGGGTGDIAVGNLSTSRDFIDVEDVAELCLRLMVVSNLAGKIFNICRGVPTSIREILDFAIACAGVDVRVEERPDRVRLFDMPVHYGDNARLMEYVHNFAFVPWQTSVQNMLSAPEATL
jgi:nucleoside-diphosphate-sugar epimerase